MGRGIYGVIVITALLAGAGVETAQSSAAVIALPYRSATAQADPALESLVVALIAQERRAAGLRPLAVSTGLRGVSRDYGRELFARGFLSHRSPDGRDPLDRALAARIRFRRVGENLAYADDVRTAHTRLMASPPHRRNILSPAFGRLGVGVLSAGRGGVIVVQVFTD